MSLASAEPIDLGSESPGSCQTGFVSDLLLRCGRGDEAAFARLFDLTYPMVSGVLTSAADDRAVQDAFVAVWRNAAAYRVGEVSAVQWILRVVIGREPARDARFRYALWAKTTTLLV